MSKTRMVNTRFWSDNFVREHLNPLDRYLFLYFLTNEKTNICGIYELPLSTIASETGLDKEMLVKMMKRLKGKIDYFEGWVIVRNFIRYQNTDSPTIKRGIERAMEEIPLRIKTFLEKEIPDGYPIHRVSIRPEELELESQLEFKPEPSGETPSQIAIEFFSKGQKYQDCIEALSVKMPREIVEAELDKFVLYWTEPNKSGTKVRWEKQPTFEIRRRLATWLNKVNGFSGRRSSPRGKQIIY